MAATPHVFAATVDNFMTDVVEASNTKPVLVDFWAPWCGPCQALMPMLERLADDYGGRFLLAEVNTDEQQQLATHFQVRSIPMVMLVHKGEVAEQFVGVQPEAAIKAMLDKYVAAELTPGVPDEPAAHAVGEPTEQAAPANVRPQDLATSLLDRRDAAGAAAAIDALAEQEAGHPMLKLLRARLAFVEAANASPDANALRAALEANPADVAARHALAAHHALIGDYGTALAEWLDVMRRDRKFGDDLGRRSLMQAFDVLGEQDPLVVQYRRRMASLLH